MLIPQLVEAQVVLHQVLAPYRQIIQILQVRLLHLQPIQIRLSALVTVLPVLSVLSIHYKHSTIHFPPVQARQLVMLIMLWLIAPVVWQPVFKHYRQTIPI